MKQPASWKEIHELVEKISKRRKTIEDAHAKLRSDHATLVKESRQLEREKKAVLEEIRLLRDIIKENKLKTELETLYQNVTEEKTLAYTTYLPEVKTTAAYVDDGIVAKDGQTLYGIKPRRTSPQEKKNVRTILHSILDATSRKNKVKLKGLARELGVEEALLKEWATVMEKHGMIKVTHAFRGEIILEKPMPKPAAR
jgi:chromosome segregation ATPase